MRAFALIALTVIAFIGTVGVPFYTHTCLHDDVSIATVFVTSDHCDTGHEEKIVRHAEKGHDTEKHTAEEKGGCCAPKDAVVLKDGCCKDDLSLLALSFNFFEHWQLQVADLPQPFNFEPVKFYETVFPTEDESLLFAANTDPPNPGGRAILNRICILRI